MIVADALGWLVDDALLKGKVEGIKIPQCDKDLCLQQFADDTNAIILNNPQSIDNFWDCLNCFCLASGSVINHAKTGFWTASAPTSPTIVRAGCKPIQNGEIFRLLGIPMGFGCSLRQRWEWVMNKIKTKFQLWWGYQTSLAARVFVLNHYLLPTIIYFISCWSPPKSHLKEFFSLVTSFLWGGDGIQHKVAKVAYSTCILPRKNGGLGLLDIEGIGKKLAAKWIVRSLTSHDYWSRLITRKVSSFPCSLMKSWTHFPLHHMFLSKASFQAKGTQLSKSLWEAWLLFKNKLQLKQETRFLEAFIPKDSIWFSIFLPPINEADKYKAHKMFNLGLTMWGELFESTRWKTSEQLQQEFHLSEACLALLQQRITHLRNSFPWFRNTPTGMRLSNSYTWGSGKSLLPLYNLPPQKFNLVSKLNCRWQVNWSLNQWIYRFRATWAFAPEAKQATLQWLILHKAIWTGRKAKERGKSTGCCKRCHHADEDIYHIFYNCPDNRKYFAVLQACCGQLHPRPFTWKEIMIGECHYLDIQTWNKFRSIVLFAIWRERNEALFNNKKSSLVPECLYQLKHEASSARKAISKAVENLQAEHDRIKRLPWQQWNKQLSLIYSERKLAMIEATLDI